MPTAIRLWPGPTSAPLATGEEERDVPQIVFHPAGDLPDAAPSTSSSTSPSTGAATLPVTNHGGCVLVCPGGGYGGLAAHEGKTIGEFFAARGIAAAVLRYRLAPRYRHPAPLLDASRAMRTLRHRAGELRLDPHKLAVMGFSAGGHLASTLSTHFDAGDAHSADPIDRESSRPDLAVLCYPVITFRGEHAHVGSRNNLLGEKTLDPAMIDLLSNDERVTDQTPPTFLFHTADDAAVKVENALLYAAALRKHGVPFALHVYERGRHGVGLASDDPQLNSWGGLLVTWLKGRGW